MTARKKKPTPRKRVPLQEYRADLDARLRGMKAQRAAMTDRLGKVEASLDRGNKRFDHVDTRLEEGDRRFDGMETQLRQQGVKLDAHGRMLESYDQQLRDIRRAQQELMPDIRKVLKEHTEDVDGKVKDRCDVVSSGSAAVMVELRRLSNLLDTKEGVVLPKRTPGETDAPDIGL